MGMRAGKGSCLSRVFPEYPAQDLDIDKVLQNQSCDIAQFWVVSQVYKVMESFRNK